ncbi:hypothetical protein C162_03944 [Paenibacillus sp. FSL R7-269]|nr:hypothetical protein C162_03944 [Paenibacillus sp. FSL R7-269]
MGYKTIKGPVELTGMKFRGCSVISLFLIEPVSRKIVRVQSLGKFDDGDRDNFYSLLEGDGVG